MRAFAVELGDAADLRDDLTDEQVADITSSMKAAKYWELLVHERLWTLDHFSDCVIDAWSRLLLRSH